MTVDVRIAHASAVFATKGAASSEVEAAVLHTHKLASRLGDARRLFPALWGRWLMTNGRGRYREALELAERLLAVAEPDGDSGSLLEAHHSLWTTMGAMGEAARPFHIASAASRCTIPPFTPPKRCSMAATTRASAAGPTLHSPTGSSVIQSARPVPSKMRLVSRRDSRIRGR